jgi:hypothetical protein
MNNTNTGGPAFPSLPIVQEFEGKRLTMTEGLTMRDYFAAKAMQGWLSTYPTDHAADEVSEETIAEFAYRMADAMMDARK